MPRQASPVVDDDFIAETREAGGAAYKQGLRPSDNPHAQGDPVLARVWAEGYKAAYYKDGQRGGPA